jgi:hypothetical protein
MGEFLSKNKLTYTRLPRDHLYVFVKFLNVNLDWHNVLYQQLEHFIYMEWINLSLDLYMICKVRSLSRKVHLICLKFPLQNFQVLYLYKHILWNEEIKFSIKFELLIIKKFLMRISHHTLSANLEDLDLITKGP